MPRLEEAPFATHMTEVDGGVVVAVQGPLDAYTVDEVTQTLLSIPTGTRALLDLSAVSFLDSRALHHLRVVLTRMANDGVSLRCRVSGAMGRTTQILEDQARSA